MNTTTLTSDRIVVLEDLKHRVLRMFAAGVDVVKCPDLLLFESLSLFTEEKLLFCDVDLDLSSAEFPSYLSISS